MASSSTHRNKDGVNKKWIVAMFDGHLASSVSDHIMGKNHLCGGIGTIVTWGDPTSDVDGGQRDYIVTTNKATTKSTTTMSTNRMEDDVGGDGTEITPTTTRTTTTTTTTQIAEIQCMPADFSSFLVGRHVVKDGSLYLMNRVDPLFFYLSAQDPPNKINEKGCNSSPPAKLPWQPFDQIRLMEVSAKADSSSSPQSSSSPSPSSSLREEQLRQAISEEQLKHLCITFRNDDVTYFRFDPSKALHWLQRKQERVLQCLIQQTRDRKRASAERYTHSTVRNNNNNNDVDSNGIHGRQTKITTNANHGGAVSDTFYMPEEDPMATLPSSLDGTGGTTTDSGGSGNISSSRSCYDVSHAEMEQLKAESVQILCSYLNEGWVKEFVHHLGLTTTQVTNGTLTSSPPSSLPTSSSPSTSHKENKQDHHSNTSRTSTPNIDPTGNVGRNNNSNIATAHTKPMSISRTVGNKRLEKVKTKGMKPISSFFGGGPTAKKAKHHQ